MTTDHPLTRDDCTCPLCLGMKDKGLVTCWNCYRWFKLRDGNHKAELIMDRYEAALASAGRNLIY